MDKKAKPRKERAVFDRITLIVNVKEDEDILDHLDTFGRGEMSPYLRGLIRADMAKNKRTA